MLVYTPLNYLNNFSYRPKSYSLILYCFSNSAHKSSLCFSIWTISLLAKVVWVKSSFVSNFYFLLISVCISFIFFSFSSLIILNSIAFFLRFSFILTFNPLISSIFSFKSFPLTIISSFSFIISLFNFRICLAYFCWLS